MERKEHDIMMDMIANQGMSFDNLVTVGLNANNTSLLSKDTYENNDWVRDHFKNQYGEFDKVAFDAFYNNAKVYYNALATANYEESMKKQATYHRDNIFAPVDLRHQGPDFIEFMSANPYQITSSIHELGRVGERTKSIDELAQANRVLLNPTTAGDNLENAQWGDTPNDSFWGYFTDTLVMAQYDSNGTHLDPVTGQLVEHKAGDFKLDNTGNFYYEKLDGRDIYGRRVLNKMNVLTTDGSFWNQYDFFDSDDLNEKSIGSSVLKNLALVGTMFIPYVGPWIAGLSIATQTAGLLGTLGKMAGGSDNPTWSALEGWSKSVSRQGATSEYAQNHTWCWENFINLIGDVAGQLKEQRFIFEKVPYVFKGANMMSKEGLAAKLAALKEKQLKLTQSSIEELRKSGASVTELIRAESELKTVAALKAQAELDSFIKGYNKLGEVLSKGYMTAITVGDTYGVAKQAGASDLDATLLTLGYAAGEYAILSTGLGTWILPELRAGRYKSLAIARALTLANAETRNLYQLFGRQLSNFTKEGKKEYTRKLFNLGRDIARAEYANGTRTAKATLASALAEGVEEVSEELLADFSKGCYDTVKWLQGSDIRINTFGYDFSQGEWNGSEILDRYGMSLIGGFVGGGLTNIGTNYKMMNSFNSMTPETAMQELVYMARNGGLQDFVKQVDKMQLGDKNLSATDYEVINDTLVPSPGTKNNNQDLYMKQALKNQVKMIENILQANGAVSDSRFLDAQTLGDLRFHALHESSTAGRYLQTYNSLNSKLVRLISAINEKIDSAQDTNGDGIVTDREQRRSKLSPEDLATVKQLEKELEETKKLIESLVKGENAYEFIADSLFEMTSALSSKFTATTFPLFAEQKYGKKYSELTEEDKAKALEDYKNWSKTDKTEQLHILSQIYRQVAEQSSKVIKSHELTYMQTSQELLSLNSDISRLYTELANDEGVFSLPMVFDEAQYLELAQEAKNTDSVRVSLSLILRLGSQEDVDSLKQILLRLNTVDPNATDEEKAQQRKEITEEYTSKLDEILSREIPAYVQTFIDRGFANAETKNQLVSLLRPLHNRTIIEATKWDAWAEENLSLNDYMSNPYLETGNTLLKSIRAVEALNATPIEENLNEFAISIGKDPINLTLLIQKLNDSFNDVSDSVTKFTLDEELSKDLNNAIYTLELYQASIRGARTDGANLSNIFGYNATLNEVASKMEGSKQPELAEIDKNVADVFDEDIRTNLNKLQFLKRLFEVNLGQKLLKQDRVGTKKDLLIYKRLKNIVSILDDDPLKDWEGFLALQNAINGMTIHDLLLRDNNTTVSEAQKEDFEREKLAAENAIYDFFQIESNKQKLNDPTKLAEFINPRKLQLYTEATELLNEGLNNLDDNSLVWWLASRIALRSQDFYSQYRLIIDPEAKKPMAPIPTQELAIYLNYASIVNGNVFTTFYNTYRKAVVEDWKNRTIEERKEILKQLNKDEILAKDELVPYALNFLSVPRYLNVILTEGTPGSGKSTGVFQPTIQLLKLFHPDILSNVAIVHGANADSAVTLRDSVGLTRENSKTYGLVEWMKEINPNWREYARDELTNNYLVPQSDYTINEEKQIVSKLGVKDTTNPPKLIIIDEILKFSAYDLDLVDKFAKKYGITVLAAGDFDQSGVVGQHTIPSISAFNGLTWRIDLNRTNFIRSPKLGVSMRTDNSVKTINLLKLQAYMQNPNGLVTFNYYEDETGLYGDKIIQYAPKEDISVSVVPQVLAEVLKLIDTLKEGEKIGYIYNNKASALYTALNQDQYQRFIDFKEGSSALGLEGQYYIIEANANSSTREYLKDIYTGMSRALQGSIIVAPIEYNGIKFTSELVSVKVNENSSVNTNATYAKKRKQLLDTVASDGLVLDIIARTAEVASKPKEPTTPPTTPPTVPPSASPGLDPGINPTPSPLKPELKEEAIRTLKEVHTKDELDSWISKNNAVDNRIIEDADIKQLIQQKEQEISQKPKTLPIPSRVLPFIPPVSEFKVGDVLTLANFDSDGNIVDTYTATVQKVAHNGRLLLEPSGEIFSSDMVKGMLSGDYTKFRETGAHTELVGFKRESENIEEKGKTATIEQLAQDLRAKLGIDTNLGRRTIYNSDNLAIGGLELNKLPNNAQYVDSHGIAKGNEIEHLLNLLINGVDPNKAFSSAPLGTALDASGQGEAVGTARGTSYRHGLFIVAAEPSTGFGDNYNFITTSGIKTVLINTGDPDTPECLEVALRLKAELSAMFPGIDFVLYTEAAQYYKAKEPKKAEPPVPITPPVEPLVYEDDLAPITLTEVIDEAIYQLQIDEANRTENTPESLANVEGQKISIEMLLHTFNTFEIGVQVDENGMPVGDLAWMELRIDSVNGLMKIKPGLTVPDYVKIIGKLRNILFNTPDKTNIQEKILNVLELLGIYCTFALKSSPRAGTQNRESGREFVSSNPNPYDKGISELTLFNGSSDTRSHEVHLKSLVAIIGTKDAGNVLELPLMALSSPFTLLLTKDVNGAYVFNQMLTRYLQLLTDEGNLHETIVSLASKFVGNPQYLRLLTEGGKLHKIAVILASEFDENPQYLELVNLFKLYNFTDSGVFYVINNEWTPAQNLQLVGPQFVTNKGYYQEAPGLLMNEETNPEAEWVTLDDFAKGRLGGKATVGLSLNPLCYVTKKVMVSMTGYVDGVATPVVNAGHPFVLVSYNTDLNTDQKVVEQYIKQQLDPSVRKEVKLMYILPPKADIRTYLGNLYKILTKALGVEAIGNLFTSYKLLKILMLDEVFRTRLEEKLSNATNLIEGALAKLEGKSQDELKDILYEVLDWFLIGFGSLKLAGLFDAVLTNIAYSRQTIDGQNYTFNQNESDTQLIESILAQAGKDGVYYKVKVTANAASDPTGAFTIPELGPNYTISGKPCKIHGKLDSYTFKGNMGWLISSALMKMRDGNNGQKYSTDNRTYCIWLNGKGLPGNSDLSEKPIRNPQESAEQRHIKSTIDYVRRKLGIDVTSLYEGKSIQEANKLLVNLINSENNLAMAFTIGNELFISNKSAFFEGAVYLYDLNGQPITDIAALSGNTGKYDFIVSMTLDGKNTLLTATYNSTTKELELIPPVEAQPLATVSVTPENFNDYVEAGRRVLEDIFEVDVLLREVFNLSTYEEFMLELNDLVYVDGDFRITLLEALLPTDDTLQALIINDIIAVERSHDPFKLDVTEENASCPPTIKIKF